MGLVKDSKDKQNDIWEVQFAIASTDVSPSPNESFRCLFFLVSDAIISNLKPAVFLFLK